MIIIFFYLDFFPVVCVISIIIMAAWWMFSQESRMISWRIMVDDDVQRFLFCFVFVMKRAFP